MRKLLTVSLLLVLVTLNADPPEWQPITGTEYSMILMTQINLNEVIFSAADGNLAAAFGPGGEADCRGIAFWQPPNPPHYDGFWYFNIVGNMSGEAISFMIYNALYDQIIPTTSDIVFLNNETVGSPYEPFLLIFNAVNFDNNIIAQNSSQLQSISPNPFNPHTDITFYLDEYQKVEISVYNSIGKKIILLLNDYLPEGRHAVHWNGCNEYESAAASGIYYINLKLPNKTITQKCLLLK
jgi:hypothetical protein